MIRSLQRTLAEEGEEGGGSSQERRWRVTSVQVYHKGPSPPPEALAAGKKELEGSTPSCSSCIGFVPVNALGEGGLLMITGWTIEHCYR